MPHTVVHAQPSGEIDYTDLAIKLHTNHRRPAIVVANIGTTWTEAIDDVAQITAAIRDAGINRSYIHSDAALAGIPLATLDQPPNFDLSHGADSISVSGHKFLGTPNPCGVIITKHHQAGSNVAYIGSTDTTLTGSRSGHAPVLLWYALRRLGITGLRDRADRARDLARYTVQELTSLSWPAWRHPHALTVMLQTPPQPLGERWHLASTDGTSHIICMPGTRQAQVDAFVADLGHVTARTAPLMYPASLRTRPETGCGPVGVAR